MRGSRLLRRVKKLTQDSALAFPEKRTNQVGQTWNRVSDGHSKDRSAVFAHSVFPTIDPIAAKKLAQSFTLEYTECQEHNRVVHDLKQELEYSYQKEEMRGLLGKIAESFLKFCDSTFYANSHEVESEETRKAINFVEKEPLNQGQFLSKYYPIAGKEEIKNRVAALLTLNSQKAVDPEMLVLTNSYEQAKYYSESIGGKAFGLDNNFITTGFVLCNKIEEVNKIKKLFNLAMVSGSVVNQLALVHCLEEGIELAGNQTRPSVETKRSIQYLKNSTTKYLSQIYQENLDPNQVFFGIGAQNFVDKTISFLKESGYDSVTILESPYHLYAKTIELLNGMDLAMVPVTDDLRISPEFLRLSLEDQYQQWLQKNTNPNATCKIAFLNNEPGNPSGYKPTTKEAQATATVINEFASRADVEFTYLSDGAYKVLHGGDEKYITDFIDKNKVNIFDFESHSKSHWTFARLSFCIAHFANPPKESALRILSNNEPQNLAYYVISLKVMESRLARKDLVPAHAQKTVKEMNDSLPNELTHIKGGVYPFIFPKFPKYINQVAPKSNPEFRSRIIKDIFSAKFSNEQLSQIFNLNIDELESSKLRAILGNFHNQIFNQKEVDFLIDRMIEKEMSIKDRVGVLCDSLAIKSGETGFSLVENRVVHKNIYELRSIDKNKVSEALLQIKQVMEIAGARFDESHSLENKEGVVKFLERVDEKIEESNFPIGHVNCRNTLFATLFGMNATIGVCVANIGFGNNGRIVPRPAFAGMPLEETISLVKSIKGYLQELQEKSMESALEIKTQEEHTEESYSRTRVMQSSITPNFNPSELVQYPTAKQQFQHLVVGSNPFEQRYLNQRISSITNNPEDVTFAKKSLVTALNSFLEEPENSKNIYSPFITKVAYPIAKIAESLKKRNLQEKSLTDIQKQTSLEINSSRPSILALFSIIDEKGNIVKDGKYGEVDERTRRENNIPSLSTRDYVREIYDNKREGFVCGEPVIGSTSGKFMIPAGIRINESQCLTFGIDTRELVKNICPDSQKHMINSI